MGKSTGLLTMELRIWLGTAVIRVGEGIWHCQYCNLDGATAATIPHRDHCPVRMLTRATEALEEWERGDRHDRLL